VRPSGFYREILVHIISDIHDKADELEPYKKVKRPSSSCLNLAGIKGPLQLNV